MIGAMTGEIAEEQTTRSSFPRTKQKKPWWQIRMDMIIMDDSTELLLLVYVCPVMFAAHAHRHTCRILLATGLPPHARHLDVRVCYKSHIWFMSFWGRFMKNYCNTANWSPLHSVHRRTQSCKSSLEFMQHIVHIHNSSIRNVALWFCQKILKFIDHTLLHLNAA